MTSYPLWPVILIAGFPIGLLAQAPPPYQTDFPPEEFRTRWETVFDRIGDRGVAIVVGRTEHDGLPGPSANERVLSALRDRDTARLSDSGWSDAQGQSVPAPAQRPAGERRGEGPLGGGCRAGEAINGCGRRQEHERTGRGRSATVDRRVRCVALYALRSRGAERRVPGRAADRKRRHHRGPLGRPAVARGLGSCNYSASRFAHAEVRDLTPDPG